MRAFDRIYSVAGGFVLLRAEYGRMWIHLDVERFTPRTLRHILILWGLATRHRIVLWAAIAAENRTAGRLATRIGMTCVRTRILPGGPAKIYTNRYDC